MMPLSQMLLEQQAGVRPRLLPDVLSLAELQRSGVPNTDDTPKYRYQLEDGRYGTPLGGTWSVIG